VLVVIVLGRASWNMVLPFIEMDFRFSAMSMQSINEPTRHVDGPRPIGRAVAQK
jgi:hypothetical protein